MTLTVRELSFSYKDRVVLHDLGLQVMPGSLVCLVGPNGSGKSTLLRCLDRILWPSRGDILVGGASIKSLRPRELARRICYMPQNHPLNFPLTVVEVVTMGRRPHLHFRPSDSDRQAVLWALSMLGLSGLARRYFDELSGGGGDKKRF